jgi:hypothetical protein
LTVRLDIELTVQLCIEEIAILFVLLGKVTVQPVDWIVLQGIQLISLPEIELIVLLDIDSVGRVLALVIVVVVLVG